MIHVITDSTAGITKEYLAQHENLHVIPLYISLGGDFVPEYDLTVKDVIDYVESTDKVPLTSQPSVGELMEIVNTIPKDAGIIMFSITGGVSGTGQTMEAVAKQCKRSNVVAIDSMTTEQGMQFLIEDALTMDKEGKSFDEIVTSLHKSIKNMRTMFVPGTLEYLRRGGRIGHAASLIGAILQIKPIIYINAQNEVDVLDKVRTAKKGYAYMIKEALKRPVRKIGVPHLFAEKEAEKVRDTLQEALPGMPIRITTGTPALSCHLGPGLVSIMVEWESEEE